MSQQIEIPIVTTNKDPYFHNKLRSLLSQQIEIPIVKTNGDPYCHKNGPVEIPTDITTDQSRSPLSQQIEIPNVIYY